MQIGLVPCAAKWRLALRRRISAIIARRCVCSHGGVYIYIADNGTYGMRRLLKDLIIGVWSGIEDCLRVFGSAASDCVGGQWHLRNCLDVLWACDWTMTTRMRWMLPRLFFCWPGFFGGILGLIMMGVWVFFLIWRCCAENHPFPALGSSRVFSWLDDPACALCRTSK